MREREGEERRREGGSVVTLTVSIILYCVNCKFCAPPCGNHMLLPQCTVHHPLLVVILF